MPNLKLIGYLGKRISPQDNGWEIDGIHFATLGGVISHVKRQRRAKEIQQAEDNEVSLGIQAQESRQECHMR